MAGEKDAIAAAVAVPLCAEPSEAEPFAADGVDGQESLCCAKLLALYPVMCLIWDSGAPKPPENPIFRKSLPPFDERSILLDLPSKAIAAL